MDENRSLHSLGVAKKMVEIGTNLGLSTSELNSLFTLGIVHDIGYQFGPGNMHQKNGGLVLKENGYQYWQEVYYHGIVQNEYFSLFLNILNQADMQIDKMGQDVGYEGRLDDIKSRYGEDSKVYQSCVDLVEFIKENNNKNFPENQRNKLADPKKEAASKHAILLIKNKKGEYLQYLEPTWQSYLFLNCKVASRTDTHPVADLIFDKLGVSTHNIQYLFDKVHSKYSVKHQKMRKYHHYFFLVDIDLNDKMVDKEFTINDTKFKWFSMPMLESDKRIQEVNGDIVGFIKEELQD